MFKQFSKKKQWSSKVRWWSKHLCNPSSVSWVFQNSPMTQKIVNLRLERWHSWESAKREQRNHKNFNTNVTLLYLLGFTDHCSVPIISRFTSPKSKVFNFETQTPNPNNPGSLCILHPHELFAEALDELFDSSAFRTSTHKCFFVLYLAHETLISPIWTVRFVR